MQEVADSGVELAADFLSLQEYHAVFAYAKKHDKYKGLATKNFDSPNPEEDNNKWHNHHGKNNIKWKSTLEVICPMQLLSAKKHDLDPEAAPHYHLIAAA